MEIIVNYYETLYGCDLPACDGRTDGQTDELTPRLCLRRDLR